MRILVLAFLLLSVTACVEDENTFTVEASPVKADIVRLDDTPDGTVSYEATFTELDKEGLLDVNVGIVTTPAANLQLNVFSQNQTLLETVTTDANGKVMLSLPETDLNGVTRLEWAGTFGGKPFRVLTNL